ncbi:MAG: hypothetical protein ACM3UZ_14790 [Acidobacteriota bacterium]
MKKNIEYVFASCYTARGYVSFLPRLISNLKRIVLLEGCPGSGKSTFMRKTGLNFRNRGYETQFWLSPRDPAYLDGIFIPQLKMAVIDGNLLSDGVTFDESIEIQCLDLGTYLRENHGHLAEIEDLHNISAELSRQVTESLNLAGMAKQEAGNYNVLSQPSLSEIAQKLSSEILQGTARADHYFASAVTSQGIVDYYEEICANCQNRYLLTGAGAGDKSKVIHDIANAALARGFSVNYYHSKLNPDEVEMIIIEERRTVVVDAEVLRTSNKPGDIIVEMLPDNDSGIDTTTTSLYEAERRFNQLLFDAIQKLDQMCEAEQRLSRLVTKAMAFEQVDICCEELVQEILTMK